MAGANGTSREHYGWTSIILHWLAAIGLVVSYITGHELEDGSGASLQQAYDAHVTWSMIFAVPLLVRILWRGVRGFRNTSHQARIFHLISRIVMIGMLVCIAGAVITGILLPWTMGQPISVGALDIPSPLPFIPGANEVLEDVHGLFGHLWMPFVALHLLGAAKHAIIDRDGVVVGILRPRRTD